MRRVGAGEGFFTANADYTRRRDLLEFDAEKFVNVDIPDGWQMTAMISRIVTSGACSYPELRKLTVGDVFRMLEMLDWKDYAAAAAERQVKANGGN